MAIDIAEVNPALIDWAVKTSQKSLDDIVTRFPQILDWIRGDAPPAYKKLQELCNYLKVPFGYMFLDVPPQKNIIETEFRTISSNIIGSPSKELQDILMDVQSITLWMRDYRIKNGFDQLDFVGCLANEDDYDLRKHNLCTEKMLEILNLKSEWSKAVPDPLKAFSIIRQRLENNGIIVVVKGFVRSYTRRILNLNEFRAFVFSDNFAPVIFINSKDSETGRLFSLIHEFAHVLLGTNHLDNGHEKPETLCNKAAINFLAPIQSVRIAWDNNQDPIFDRILWIAKMFNTSAHAMAIHLFQMDLIKERHLQRIIDFTNNNLANKKKASSGGDYWNTKLFSISPSFVNAVASQVNAGITQYTEAFRLLDTSKISTYESLVEKVNQ